MVSSVKYKECRSCGAVIVWAQHETTGKKAPIDAEPYEDGNVVLINDGERLLWRVATSYDVGPADVRPRYKNHFATCPQADQWQSKQERGAA